MLGVTLRHGFGGFDLDLSFQAPAGVTAVFGRSGAGKTTLVNAVAGLLRPDSGRIVLAVTPRHGFGQDRREGGVPCWR